LRELRLILSSLHVLTAEPVSFFLTVGEFLLHAESDLDRKRGHRLDDDIADRCVERAAVHGLAQTDLTSLQWVAATPVGGDLCIVVRVVTY